MQKLKLKPSASSERKSLMDKKKTKKQMINQLDIFYILAYVFEFDIAFSILLQLENTARLSTKEINH